jgi:hypothetical protein
MSAFFAIFSKKNMLAFFNVGFLFVGVLSVGVFSVGVF